MPVNIQPKEKSQWSCLSPISIHRQHNGPCVSWWCFDDQNTTAEMSPAMSGDCCNTTPRFETHLEIKSREISFAHNLFHNRFDILHRARQWYCHALDKMSTDWSTGMEAIDKRDFSRFELNISIRRMSYSNSHWCLTTDRFIWCRSAWSLWFINLIKTHLIPTTSWSTATASRSKQ